MASSVNIAFVQQFSGNVLHLAQQKYSRLRNAVRVKTGVVGKSAHFERLAKGAMFERTARHQPTALGELAHSRRRVTLRDFERGQILDEEDEIRMLIEADNAYAMALGGAAGRQFDDLIIAAAVGNAYAMDASDSATTTALPSAQKVAAGSTDGMTLAKVLSAKDILDSAEIDEDDRVLVLGSEQLNVDALDVTEMTSADYNSVRALVKGQIDTFLGFQWIRSERLTLDASSDRLCLAFQKNAMGLAIGRDVTTTFRERPDLSNATQVLVKLTAEATRIEDEGVVTIACNEA